MIDVQNLTKTYGRTNVVDNVSLTIPRGGIVALVGPNGAGKSTLLSVMSRLLKPTSGRVMLDGQDVTRTPGAELARKLTVLRQDNTVTTRMTVEDLVGFGRFPHSRGHLTATDRDEIEQALDHMALGPIRDRFLDEPLNNLDIKHAVAMMGIFRRLAEEFGKTVVVVLHDINFASCYADRIVALRDGRVVHDGIPADVIKPDVIQDIYGIGTSVHEIEGQRLVYYYRPLPT